MKFFYFYKITNIINNKFYCGVHETEKLDDGYMGSGIALKKAYLKYGIENFKKEILAFFSSSEEMYLYEEQIVNDKLVQNQQCYNMIIGGKSHKKFVQLGDLAKLSASSEQTRKNKKEGIYKYWHTGNIEAKKRKQSEGNKKYWTTGNVEEKKKRHSQIQKQSYVLHSERREKLCEALYNRWNGEDGEQNKKKLGQSLRNSEKHKEASKRLKESNEFKGYNNPEFTQIWKSKYDEDSDVICALLKYSNLPDSFVVYTLFDKKVKVYKLIDYYVYTGKLPKPIDWFESTGFYRVNNNWKGHKTTNNKKTVFANEIKYDILPFHPDFFIQFEKIVELMNDDTVSDSMITNNEEYSQLVPNFEQVIEYFTEMGVVFEKQTILIRVPKIVSGKKFTVPSKKTKFKISYKGVTKKLIDKELNEYGIDDNGKPFFKGRIKLD